MGYGLCAVALGTLLMCGCLGTTNVFDSEQDAADDPVVRDLSRDPTLDLDASGESHPDGDLETDIDRDGDADLDADVDSYLFDDPDAAAISGSGSWDDPFVIRSLPFEDVRDTSDSPYSSADSYACAADTDESGPEWVYRVEAPVSGFLTASLEAEPGADPDIHLLASADQSDCLARDHTDLSYWMVGEDSLYLVVDTWVNGEGTELTGEYTLLVDQAELPGGDCRMRVETMAMFNRTEPLQLPAFGPVVKEAHLVTAEEFEGSWPTSSRDGIPDHYVLSESVTAYAMGRTEPWAPAGEGGSLWGQGSTGAPVPAEDEAWYVNMYWRNRPARGTRMLVFNPVNGRAVVASAGY